MTKEYWNSRYEENATVYGEKPNRFFQQFIDSRKPGTLLLPADGEGRNALYAASKKWKVDAFDFSDTARAKALKKAADRKLEINYELKRIEDFRAGKKYNAVALIYVHLPEELRRSFHKQVYDSLEPGGFLVFEAFAKEQLHFNSGGPRDAALLYDAPSICGDFPFLHILSCGQREVELDEGPFHRGKASVLQLVGQKI